MHSIVNPSLIENLISVNIKSKQTESDINVIISETALEQSITNSIVIDREDIIKMLTRTRTYSASSENRLQ